MRRDCWLFSEIACCLRCVLGLKHGRSANLLISNIYERVCVLLCHIRVLPRLRSTPDILSTYFTRNKARLACCLIAHEGPVGVSININRHETILSLKSLLLLHLLMNIRLITDWSLHITRWKFASIWVEQIKTTRNWWHFHENVDAQVCKRVSPILECSLQAFSILIISSRELRCHWVAVKSRVKYTKFGLHTVDFSPDVSIYVLCHVFHSNNHVRPHLLLRTRILTIRGCGISDWHCALPTHLVVLFSLRTA